MKQILIPLQAYLLGRTGSTAAGMVLLLSLVWWGGPYVGLESERGRLAVMGGALLLAALIWVGRRLTVRRRAAQFASELKSGGSVERQAEIEELKGKMESAIASLKASGLGGGYRGSSALYALPWFMIIGPSAAGKTTLLRHSGLHFPYAHGEDIDIKGFGGTRNCDWWFADEAVLLDTAGRYTTEEDDRGEWLSFLELLRKYRPRVPVNGVIVAVSLAEVLTADQGGIEGHVKIIRDRLDELIRSLGCSFPVYLVFTKCDLLHGFSSFFEDLGEHDRTQIWGSWLAEGEGKDLGERFQQAVKRLHGRLCELRLRKIGMQRKFERKGEIFDFPLQFATAGERLEDFFRLLVKENPYQETPRFCGVYFTSGTQEGTPLQRIVGKLRQAFGYLEEAPPEGRVAGRSYFIRKLFQEVIFPNAGATTRNRRRDRLSRWLKGAWVGASLALIVGCVLLLSTSFTSNTLLANDGRKHLQDLETQLRSRDRTEEAVYRQVSAVHDHYRRLLAYEDKLPPHLLFGVYRGADQIAPTLSALLGGLEVNFFRPAVTALEYRLENYARQWEAADDKGQEKIRDVYYQALKTYLMLSRPERLSVSYATPLLAELWLEQIRLEAPETIPSDTRDDMEAMIALFLSHITESPKESFAVPPWGSREPVIAKAREHLRTLPNAQRLYTQILNKDYAGLKDLALEDLVRGQGASLVRSQRDLPGIYTARGWAEFIAPEIARTAAAASRGDWVIGFAQPPGTGAAEGAEPEEGTVDRDLAERLEREIRGLYFADYAENWLVFLESVHFDSFGSLQEASKKLLLIAQSDGPLGELMRSVSRNINLEEPARSAGENVARSLEGAKQWVPELDSVFGDLRKFCNPAEKMTVSLLLNQYLLAISSVQNEMERLAAAVNVSGEASRYSARILSGTGGDLELYKSYVTTSSMLNGIEPRIRKLASTLFTEPIRHAWSCVLAEAGQDLQNQWKTLVVAPYSRKLKGKFPFAGEAGDAALADVGDFFRPQDGVLWAFIQNHLSPFLVEGRGQWREKTWLELGPGFSRDLLRSVARSRVISGSLFRRGSENPHMDFYIYPMPARGVSETCLVSNGQEYRYRNEPQEWRKFSWPGEAEKLGARVTGIAGRAVSRGELSHDGLWGLFHLLRKARVTQENGTEYLSVWELEGSSGMPITVQFKIRADRENNLFDKHVLAGFELPASLF